jgi:hypothetical protein
MTLRELIYQKIVTYITLVQTKLQLVTLAYNGDFQNKTHHILLNIKVRIQHTFIVLEFFLLHVWVWIIT